jgi:hypothetical protein
MYLILLVFNLINKFWLSLIFGNLLSCLLHGRRQVIIEASSVDNLARGIYTSVKQSPVLKGHFFLVLS